MTALDLDTFLVALYTIVDDLYRRYFASYKPRRRGKKPWLTDSEVLTLVICAQWFSGPERKFLRKAIEQWHGYFPNLLSQSAFNRRSRDLAGVLIRLVPKVAEEMGAHLAAYQALDGVPVPLMRRCRGQYHRLFADEAQIGKGGSDKDWYYGCQLLAAVSADGVITGFLLAPASTETRWLGESLLCWRTDVEREPWSTEDLPASHRKGGKYVGPTGPIGPRCGVGVPSEVPYVADGGFKGVVWQTHWLNDYHACVLTKDLYEGKQAKAARKQHSSWRSFHGRMETVNEHLTDDFHLSFPGARSRWGLLTRIAAKLVALNLGIWVNRLFGRPDFSFATLFNF